MDILYNYYFNKLSNKENVNEKNNKIIEKTNFPNNIDETIKALFTINLDDYFSKSAVKREDYYINRGGKKIMTKQTAFLVESIFKYFDLCLILFLKENQTKFLEYMKNPKNKLFKYYANYKILTMEKPNKNKANKEIGAFIYYFIKLKSSINLFNPEDIKDIYLSDNLTKFINSFSLFSDKNKKDLLKSFEGITREDIKTNDIEYKEFIQYLKDKDDFKDLLLFFLNNEKNEGNTLFDYLKIRISLIEQNILDYFYLNNYLNSQIYIQKIIENNITYLNDSFRVQYFLSTLLYMLDSSKYKDYFKRNNNKIIKIDRFKANNFKEEYNEKKIPDTFLNKTIFGQLFHSLGDLTAKKFLKDEGKKLFKVDLGEEEAIDQGGPYSEILSDICDELQSDYINLFVKTPNNKNNEGELRDRYIINPNCNKIIEKKAFKYIGKLMALAISSGETLNFNFHPIIWKGLLENEITFEDYKTVDINLYNRIKELKNDKSLISNYLEPKFVIQNLNGNEIELIENGRNIDVTLENIDLYIETIQYKIIEELNDKIKFIKDGLYSAIEKNILQILNWEQLEVMVCGEIIFNLEDFKKHTTYNSEGDLVIQWFWEWLQDCDENTKFKYLKFVSGRSRLPRSQYEHEIRLLNDKNKFPRASTCFFRLYLPKYDSKEVLCKKMKYVIENVTSITDDEINHN